MITFTAKDLAEPKRQLPRAVFLALGIATTIYVAIALGVFGTLPVGEVIAAGATAIAVAAEPILGEVGFWMMSITALFATAGATNAGLYPATGLADELTSDRQFPPVMGARTARIPNGLLITALASIVFVLAVRPHCGGIDRECDRPGRLHPDHGGPPSGAARDRRADVAPDPRCGSARGSSSSRSHSPPSSTSPARPSPWSSSSRSAS